MMGPKDFIQVCLAENGLSPDISALQFAYDKVPLFIYGMEKKGFSDHGTMKDWPLVGIGKTVSSKYNLFLTDQHEPLVFEQDPQRGVRIQGEVYQVTPEFIFSLDRKFGNSGFLYRQRVALRYVLPEEKSLKTKEPKITWAFTYLGNPKMWQTKFVEGQMTILQPFASNDDTGQYSSYTSQDDKEVRKKIAALQRRAF